MIPIVSHVATTAALFSLLFSWAASEPMNKPLPNTAKAKWFVVSGVVSGQKLVNVVMVKKGSDGSAVETLTAEVVEFRPLPKPGMMQVVLRNGTIEAADHSAYFGEHCSAWMIPLRP
jgi:hypothetical protein